MDMQNVAKLDIPEGEVRTIHDKDGNLIWGKVSYGVKYKGDTAQTGAPTPSAPVPVQTVTGEQTISINGAAHTVNLGSIELCEIGDYQDYIYKSGDKWYVHKEISKDSASGRTWEWAAFSPNGWYYSRTSYGNYGTSTINAISDSFVGVSRDNAPNTSSAFITMANNGNIGIRNPDITGASNIAAFKTWLDGLNTSWFYVLATPTDTEITNAALIAQLEAVEQWLTRYGYNATVSGNLPIIIDRTAL